MKVTINSRPENIDACENLESLKKRFSPLADLIIINGFPAEKDTPIKENDEIIFIKKNTPPTFEEFEYMLTARHTPKIHKKLKNASVAIGGLGGLGSNAAVSLARMGIGRLKLVDFDTVEPTNLNRQHYFIPQIGMKKTDALAETVARVNPFIKIEKADILVTNRNICEIFSGFDVILECFDNKNTKAMFTGEVLKKLPNSFLIGASGVAGVFSHKLFQTKPLGKSCVIIGDFENEAAEGMGLMATRAAIAANIQANIAVRHILGEGND